MSNYVVLCFVDLLYALQFLCTKSFQNRNESTILSALNFSLGSSITICIYSLILSKFRIEITLFSLIVALVIAMISITLNFFSFRALSIVNLSVYSVVIMMGGMIIPSFYGIVFLSERLTIGKVVGTFLIILALLCGIDKSDAKKGAWKYYVFVFIINGLFATVQKVHQTHTDVNVPAGSLMFLSYALAIIISVLFIVNRHEIYGFQCLQSNKNLLTMGGYGLTNCTAELLSMAVMENFPASVQFVFISGGVIIFSTIFSMLKHEKQSLRVVVSIALAIFGMVLIPL